MSHRYTRRIPTFLGLDLRVRCDWPTSLRQLQRFIQTRQTKGSGTQDLLGSIVRPLIDDLDAELLAKVYKYYYSRMWNSDIVKIFYFACDAADIVLLKLIVKTSRHQLWPSYNIDTVQADINRLLSFYGCSI